VVDKQSVLSSAYISKTDGEPYLTAKVTAELREKGEQPETPVDKMAQDAISRAALQAIQPNV
jgi:hypothetical protein